LGVLWYESRESAFSDEIRRTSLLLEGAGCCSELPEEEGRMGESSKKSTIFLLQNLTFLN
jgi:hypothetical protein